MTVRALYAAWNTGIETVTPLSTIDLYRGIYAVWNTGIEENIPLSRDDLGRALHGAWNTGIEMVIPLSTPDKGRALHTSWSVVLLTSIDDMVEVRLLGVNYPRDTEGILRAI